ncbi:protein often near L-alanine-DL-glutamate epimerase (cell wall recycling) [Rufibacter radiotolerans]|uniref:Protein often near L-alanine-DL-glutamate epimerase (Cell wall recycling) n=1 Tax=Rufibacter radiotolerans TaxID=1379910 RepID=A0A0H4VHU3_9BACT|nr:DUF1611 domain-containing protein [Rufibacter radiotolerans]AKQ45285.1 protein often near L-alanine-DL-glutamate epimerase (cell wall recycling) [Rufibacter radiotolerans]
MDGNAIILTGGLLDQYPAKTAHGLIRGTERYNIIGVIDAKSAGKDAGEVVDGKNRNIPVYADLADFLKNSPEKAQYCLVGIAPKGGKLPEAMKATIAEAITNGINIVSGLHEYIRDMPDLADLARQHNVQITDVRKPKPKSELHFWTGKIKDIPAPRIAVLGTDVRMGKRTTTRLLTQAAEAAGFKAQMIFTGQTGWMQGRGKGFILDSTYNDFVSGELEYAILSSYEESQPDVFFIEGQAALRNPSGPCGSEYLVSGQVKYVVLQHAPARVYFDDNEELGIKIPPVSTEIQLIELYGAKVLAVTLNTAGLTLEQAREYQRQYAAELGLPVVLPLEDGVGRIVDLVKEVLEKETTAV